MEKVRHVRGGEKKPKQEVCHFGFKSFWPMMRIKSNSILLWRGHFRHIFSLQPLHQVGNGLCQQQREHHLRAQHHPPHIPDGGQHHHRLRGHPAALIRCHLSLRKWLHTVAGGGTAAASYRDLDTLRLTCFKRVKKKKLTVENELDQLANNLIVSF